MNVYLKVFYSRAMAITLALGFISGLPLALTGSTLQAWLTVEQVSLKEITLYSLVGQPYALKFIWAPFFDTFAPPVLTRRRGWLLISQLLAALAVTCVAWGEPRSAPWMLALLAFVVAFFSATQDIVIDAYRAELLTPEERGAGAAISVLGYRLGMITSGAGGLILAKHLGFPAVYLCMAALLLVGAVAAYFSPEPRAVELPPRTFKGAVLEPLREFFARAGSFEILGFVFLYKIGDVLAASLTTAFLLRIGFELDDVGAVSKGAGVLATIIGGLVGGALMSRLTMRQALFHFGILQAISTFLFAVLAAAGPNMGLMALTICVENFFGGLGTAALVAFLIALCNQRFTATQYALFTSFASLGRIYAAAPAGYMAERLGYFDFFLLCVAAAVPALLLLMVRFEAWAVTPSTSHDAPLAADDD